MSDEAALVRAIHADPDCNTARLVYADWLDEHATTDQQRARSEWIRLTCWDRGKRSTLPTGTRTRLPGEPKWIRDNAHRLWPNLFGLEPPLGQARIALLTGTIVLRVEVPSAEDRIDYADCVISVFAERGVTQSVAFASARAARIAPRASLDEPLARLGLTSAPPHATAREVRRNALVVYRQPFARRGLDGLWDALEGHSEIVGAAARDDVAKLFPRKLPANTPVGRDERTEMAELLNDALTRWARAAVTTPPVAEAA